MNRPWPLFDSAAHAGASWAVLCLVPVQLLVAQAMVEHGMLDAMVAGFAAARYRVELYIGQGNSFYLLIGLLALLVLFLGRRRR
jgi:LPXTG-motif cell wall-anchored protein